jgi:hypothetical protein
MGAAALSPVAARPAVVRMEHLKNIADSVKPGRLDSAAPKENIGRTNELWAGRDCRAHWPASADKMRNNSARLRPAPQAERILPWQAV